MKRIFTLALVMVLALSLLTACGGNNSGTSTPKGNELVGVWVRVTEDGKIAEIYEFMADGKVKLWSWWVGVMEATYKIAGDKLTLSAEGLGDATQKFKVNGNTMTLIDDGGSVTELTRNDKAWDTLNDSDSDDDWDGYDSNAAEDAVYMIETASLTLESLRKAAESEGVEFEEYEASSYYRQVPVDGFEFQYQFETLYGGGSLSMLILEFGNEDEAIDYMNARGSFDDYLAAGKFVAVIMGDEVVGMRLAQKIFVNAGADPGDVQVGGSAEMNALKTAAEGLGYEVNDYYSTSFMPVKPADGFSFYYSYTTSSGGGAGDIFFYEFKSKDDAQEYAEEQSGEYKCFVVRGKFVAQSGIDHESAPKLINDLFDKAGIK